MSETMRPNEIKTTDDAILFLKQLPGFACYHRYFETKLAGDFAFELAKFMSKREAEIERLNKDFDALNLSFVGAGENEIKYKAQIKQMRDALTRLIGTLEVMSVMPETLGKCPVLAIDAPELEQARAALTTESEVKP